MKVVDVATQDQLVPPLMGQAQMSTCHQWYILPSCGMLCYDAMYSVLVSVFYVAKGLPMTSGDSQ